MDKNIVIIGGGFAGINLANHLENREGFQVILVDKNNYNFFPPLLYQVATGFLDVSSISVPFRSLIRKAKNIRFRMGELVEIFPKEKRIQLSNGILEYDYLVLATGTMTNYFGMKNIEKNAIPMKTIEDAVEMRNYLLQKAEEASYTKERRKRAKLRNIVISGAGPSGVEVAGMLAEMRNNIFATIYPELAKGKFEIYLIDGAPTVLPPMSEKSQKYTYRKLEKLGIHVKLNSLVEDYRDDVVYLNGGETIKTETLIWTAGVTSQKFKGIPEESYGRGRRLQVNEFNAVKSVENIYAIGDTCIQDTDSGYPGGHPQLATVAMQQGNHLARNLLKRHEGKAMSPFVFRDKGSMAIIGRNMAVAELKTPRRTFTGWLAWMMWLFVHLFQLISYRNRIHTMWNWTSSYFTRDQSLGMIVRPSHRLEYETEIAEKAEAII